MEIMQQGSSHLDGRWRTHMLPYSGHGLGSLPNLHDQLRQQIAQTHQRQDQHPEHIQQQMQQQPQQHRQEQQLHHPSHRQLLHQHHESSRSQPQDLTPSRSAAGTTSGHIPHHLNSLVSPVQSSSLPSHSPTSPTQSTPSPGKSGGKEGEEKKEVGEWEQYNAGAAFLGPTLWDKTLSYDSDLKLEYMDLDEFLNENGIPVDESAVAAKRSTSSSGSGGTTSSSTTSTSTSTNTNNTNTTSGASSLVSISPEAPSSPDTPVTAPQLGNSMGVAPQGPPPSSMNGMGGSGLSVVPPPALSPQEYSPQDYVGDDYCSSPESSDPHSPLQVHEPVPGQEFDPRTRIFSEEELKPQPMIKKSRKQFVPNELKDDKYWARRRKNNMAAKRSRDARRLKENQIAMRANFLEKENNAMTVELQKAQAIVESLKKRLAMYETV